MRFFITGARNSAVKGHFLFAKLTLCILVAPEKHQKLHTFSKSEEKHLSEVNCLKKIKNWDNIDNRLLKKER